MPDETPFFVSVLLAVKAHQTARAADWLRKLAGKTTTVLVLQNGVDHRERVAPCAGQARVLPAVLWCPAAPAARRELTGRTAGVFRDEAMARLAGQLAAECVAVGRAEGAQARNGVVPRLGARHAIPTPVTDAIVPLLRACGPATG